MADLQSDVWTLRNTRHSKVDRWSQFKANCRTIEAGFDFSLSMFWSVWQASAGSPILAGLVFPLQGDAPRMGRETAGFTACPLSHHQPTRAPGPAPHTANTVALRARAGGKDTPACCCSFKQHGTSSVRRPTLHSWHLVQTRSAFTLGKRSNTDFESSKPCLPTSILTSSPLRRTQLAESNTVFASNSKNL